RGIFTTATVSPGPSWRQCSSRYAIHAGRNLPDKELRYLRTVIVTAAVYRGFGRQLRSRSPAPLTYRHRAGVRLYTSACALAESCVFDKQSLEPILCGSHTPRGGRAPLVPSVRGQFAESPHEGSPERLRMLAWHTCVGLRYGPTHRPHRAFRGRGVRRLPDRSAVALAGRGCLAPRSPSPRRHLCFNLCAGCRNIN